MDDVTYNKNLIPSFTLRWVGNSAFPAPPKPTPVEILGYTATYATKINREYPDRANDFKLITVSNNGRGYSREVRHQTRALLLQARMCIKNSVLAIRKEPDEYKTTHQNAPFDGTWRELLSEDGTTFAGDKSRWDDFFEKYEPLLLDWKALGNITAISDSLYPSHPSSVVVRVAGYPKLQKWVNLVTLNDSPEIPVSVWGKKELAAKVSSFIAKELSVYPPDELKNYAFLYEVIGNLKTQLNQTESLDNLGAEN